MDHRTICFCIVELLILSAFAVADTTDGEAEIEQLGCAALKEPCCQGKDNKCRSSGPRMNDPNGTICFCDSSCLRIGDCCQDYKQLCKPVDCELAETWDEWGDCDARCGPGIKQRVRKIVKHPLNGGKACETTVEKAACEGTNCKFARAPEGYEELKETGKIIPAEYGLHRKSKVYNPYKDIRKNLFDHYAGNESPDFDRPSYCMKFELTEVRAGCNVTSTNSEFWSNHLTKGAAVCVECQPTAMKFKLGGRCKGHGVYLKESRWSAVTLPGCHGKWILQSSEREECMCDPESKFSLILI